MASSPLRIWSPSSDQQSSMKGPLIQVPKPVRVAKKRRGISGENASGEDARLVSYRAS